MLGSIPWTPTIINIIMKTLLTIGTSHTQSGFDFVDKKEEPDYFFKTWPGYLEQRLGTRVINLGVAGHGIDSIISRTWFAIDLYNPDCIILEYPSVSRFSLSSDIFIDYEKHPLYNISHIVSSEENHWCQNVVNRKILTPSSKKTKFMLEWMSHIDEMTYINHSLKFKTLRDYIRYKQIKVHYFIFSGNYKDALNDEWCMYPRRVYDLLVENNVWLPSSDGTNHMSWETEKWFVDNFIIKELKK